MFDRDMRYLVVSHRYLVDFRLEGQNLIGRSHERLGDSVNRLAVAKKLPQVVRQVGMRESVIPTDEPNGRGEFPAMLTWPAGSIARFQEWMMRD